MENISIVDVGQTERGTVVVDLPTVCEIQYIIEVKEEPLHDELGSENVYNSSPSVTDVQPHDPELDSKDNISLMGFKIEMEEEQIVFKRKRRAREVEKAPLAKRPNSEARIANLEDAIKPQQKKTKQRGVKFDRKSPNVPHKDVAEIVQETLVEKSPSTKNISPERQPCSMSAPSVEELEGTVSTASSEDEELLYVIEIIEGPEGAAAASVSSDPVFEFGWSEIDQSTVPQDVKIEFFEELEAAASTTLSEIRINDNRFDSTFQDWIQMTNNDCPSDDDDDDNIDALLLPTVQERNALTEPACDGDLSLFQAKVLQREDAANDRALRDIVPDDCFTFKWSNDRQTFLGQRETFNCTTGPTFEVTDQTRPIDIFDKMFDTDLIDRLCTETNRYAEQRIALQREQNKLTPKSRFNRWCPTDRDEMISFLTIQILQGLYPLIEEESYFSFNGFGTMPYFSKIMSYNRFLLLKSFLHFVDDQTLQDTARLGKIRPIIDYFNNKFSSLYMPSQDIAIDESLLKWHGRLSFAQKISTKAAKVGVKTYELCESSSGYLWKFFVYTGKAEPTRTTADSTDRRPDDNETNDEPTDRLTTGDNGDRPTNATARIVYDLVEPLLHRGHTIIMDNFYNSPLLCRSLKRQKTDCFGTLRLNREFVPESVKNMTKSELRQGEAVATYTSDLSVLVWRDANVVSMISTYHKLQIGTQDKYNRLTYKPKIVLDYNKAMGGVDRKDQFLSAQPLERTRNKVWYKKLFRRLYNTAVFNCFVIYSSVQRNMSHRQFRTVLAEELIIRHRQIDLTNETRRLTLRPSSTGQQVTKVQRNTRHKTQARPVLKDNHFPIRTGSKFTVCRFCAKKCRTVWKCEECNLPLCINGCFRAYHKP